MTRDDVVWSRHRQRLVRVAYGVLGVWSDAEDVVQDVWLRWQRTGPDTIVDTEAWLVTATTRRALDQLRRAHVRRETYVGTWLPEPTVLDDPADATVTADNISYALLTVLESLSPLERTAFVLRDVFAYPYADIAGILDRTEAAVRQLARRARVHVRERAPRYEVDPDVQHEVVARFLSACLGGDVDALLALLAPDVELVSDTGGVGRAPRRTVVGRDNITRFVLAVVREPGLSITLTRVNAEAGVVVRRGAAAQYVAVAHVAAGTIRTINLVANVGKLQQVNRTLRPPGAARAVP